MHQRSALWAGSFLLLAGCLASVYLIVALTRAYFEGIFSTIVTETPSNRFAAFQCPRLWGRDETNTVSVSITNPTSDSLNYSVEIMAVDFAVDTPTPEQKVTLSGRQTATLAWKIRPLTTGSPAINFQALSNADTALPGPFHLWPTSFRESSGVLVLDAPLTGGEVIAACALSLLAGVALVFPFAWKQAYRIARRVSCPLSFPAKG